MPWYPLCQYRGLYVHKWLCNCMELSPWPSNKSSADQEIPRILWNRKFHYRIHKNLASVPILNQINPVHACHPLTVTLILILSSHLKQGLPSGFHHPSSSTKALYKFLFSPHMAHDLPNTNNIWQRSLSIRNFPHSPVSFCFGPNI